MQSIEVVFDFDDCYKECLNVIASKMNNGNVEEFDGISLIVWTQDNKIKSLKEFGCNLHNYNPYRDSDIPVFREEKANWF